MIYAISDIHGEYAAYRQLLKKIKFSDSDELYILGDCLDRGSEPIKLLQDMMLRPNIYPIIGNHEYMAASVLSHLMKEITDESCKNFAEDSVIQQLLLWQQDGGSITLEQFKGLGMNERYDILEYLDEFSLFEKLSIQGRKFVLVHAGLEHFDEKRELADYNLHELIFNPPDYNRIYFQDRYLVTGHLPTLSIEDNNGRIMHKNNHIAIDCGKVFGGNLAAICLNTMEEFYV